MKKNKINKVIKYEKPTKETGRYVKGTTPHGASVIEEQELEGPQPGRFFEKNSSLLETKKPLQTKASVNPKIEP